MECGAVGERSCGVAKPGKCCSDTEALNIRFPAWHSCKLEETGMSGLLRDVKYEGNINVGYDSEILVNLSTCRAYRADVDSCHSPNH